MNTLLTVLATGWAACFIGAGLVLICTSKDEDLRDIPWTIQ